MRLVRPSLVLLCGPAACGKSTFAQRHFRPTQIISSDWARGRVCDDERDQRFQTQAFALVRCLTELRLGLNRLCVVDSTALSPAHRREYHELANAFRVPCVVFLFDVPLAQCIERDLARERTVGKAVIERQHLAFEQTKATLRQEGFDQVIELADEDLDKVQIEIIFRPVPQSSGGPLSRPPQEVRHARRPWQQGPTGGPAPREAQPAAPAPPAAAAAAPAAPASKPEVGAPTPPPQPAAPAPPAAAKAPKPAAPPAQTSTPPSPPPAGGSAPPKTGPGS